MENLEKERSSNFNDPLFTAYNSYGRSKLEEKNGIPLRDSEVLRWQTATARPQKSGIFQGKAKFGIPLPVENFDTYGMHSHPSHA